MPSGQPKVGPKLKLVIPEFKRTDFSGDIERLGGFTTNSGRQRTVQTRAFVETEKHLRQKKENISTAGGLSIIKAAVTSEQVAQAPGSSTQDYATSGAIFDEWLASISQSTQDMRSAGTPARQRDGTEMLARSPRSPASPRAAPVPHAALTMDGATGNASSSSAVVNFEGVPLETFDSAEDFEVRTPEEWLALCKATPGRPQACVLHFVSHEWNMLPCWVHDYEAAAKRYLIELEDGSRKHVKRLALRFNAEDAANFACRVETCRAKKQHCELQQAFIKFIESQDDALVSPLVREQKERMIRQCLHRRCHVEEASNYISTIRELILEIERSYVLSMKFAKVKDDLIEGNGTPCPVVYEDSPFVPLLRNCLPQPPPYLGLVAHKQAEQQVVEIVSQLQRQPTLFANIWNVTYVVWRRFGDEIQKHRILDTSRRSVRGERTILRANQAELNDRVFSPDEFIIHMEEHRKDAAVTLARHWRDFIVSEVLDKMSEGSNFFVDNAQKHMRSPLHRVLRKLDLILNAQMRWFVENSIHDWVAFMRSFEPSPSQSLPPPLLTISLSTRGGEVVLVPDGDVLISRIMELINGVTKVTAAISQIEFELVPFCSLVQDIMYKVDPADPLLIEAKRATEEVIRNCLKGPQEVQSMYQQYAYLLSEEVVDLDALDIDGVRQRTAAYMQAGMEIEKLTASVVKSPFFELRCTDIIEHLSSRAYYLASICLSTVSHSVQQRSTSVLNEWLETHERILSNPDDEEELAQLKQFMSDIMQLKTKPLMATTRHIHKQIDMLSDFNYDIEHEVVERSFRSFGWPIQIQIDVCDSERSLDTQKQKFMDKLYQEKTEFERDMSRYQDDLEWVKSLNDYSLANKCATKIYTLKENLDRAKERVQSFVEREKLFNIEMSDYSELDTMNEAFEPYFKLWTAAIEFKHSEEEWLNGALSKLNKEDIDQIVEEQFKESYKMFKQFEGSENPQAVAKDLREDIGNFRQNMPVIHAICQEAFQMMHFIMLFDELDTDMDMEDGLTLQQLLEIGILDHIETVERISGEAQKQWSLKTALQSMKKEWKPMELTTISYKDTGTSIVKGVDDIQALLDDHIVKTQGIRGSPFVKPIEKEVRDWETRLLYIQDLLEQWLACQRSWLYLEPIFSSDDIQRQMPTEAKRFGQINQLWRTTMASVAENPNVLDVSDLENLLANFTNANRILDLIQKGLNDYLETKRLAFPRFFFLSNDELLMILSQTKDPTAVQPHMNKCFEGINRVRFDDKNEIIMGMFSVEGESVPLTKPVNVVEGDKKGNVEKWLMDVQDSMISCLTEVTGQSVKAYASTERTKWVLEWPAQSIIAVDNIYWTKEVAQAIETGKLDEYHKTCVAQLSGLVNLVRGDLTKLMRQTLSAVVTIDVHNRDVVKDLVNAKITSSKEFDWMAQLRYNWCVKGSVTMPDTEMPNTADKCQVAIINAVLYYGFEYLGNSDRLVITPLTDRCYRTLMGAFHLFYGGAPEGPAGTGKTESTKDLAKACAVQCVVFNCSDGLDYIAMGKFFKGLASSGAWCCFDEFNRINLEVLSVISQQVATIQKAVREKKKIFIFEGTEIQLVPSCAVNITMNPGYAGRSELPET
jgi:dynein heavy chain